MLINYTHSELVELARKWLADKYVNDRKRNVRKPKLPIVITEMTGQGEQADAIGWTGGVSFLVECKASRADFKGDARKCYRRKGRPALGMYRYYLCSEELIQQSEVPDNWGLLYADDGRVHLVKAALPQDVDYRTELMIFMSLVRRIAHPKMKGANIRIYTDRDRNNPTATATIERAKA